MHDRVFMLDTRTPSDAGRKPPYRSRPSEVSLHPRALRVICLSHTSLSTTPQPKTSWVAWHVLAYSRPSPLWSGSSSRLARCRDNTRVCGEKRRDDGGLEPKSKRGWGKRESRLRPTGDTQGHGPSTQRTRIDTGTEGCKGINICINKRQTINNNPQ